MAKQILYPVLRPIRYKQPGPNFRKIYDKGDFVDLSHLTEGEIALLQKQGRIGKPGPAVANNKEVKE